MRAAMLKKYAFIGHKQLMWLAGAMLLTFLVSAATHPILSWTGPKAGKHRPPSAVIKGDHVGNMASVLRKHQIDQALIVKIVPTELGNLLQVTEDKNVARRYFDLKTGEEILDFDQHQAVWLARYYLSKTSSDEIRKVDFITEFNSAYPWVNRLLPVYKVQFADQGNTSAFIYTELNALASVGNDYKTRMQAVFRTLHTWSWLSNFESARLIIMVLLMSTITLMTLSGIALLIMIRGRKTMPRRVKFHRGIAYVVAIPILGFCVSGFYHLLIYGFVDLGLLDKERGMSSPKPINLLPIVTTRGEFELGQNALNHISLIDHDGQIYLRASEAVAKNRNSSKLSSAENDEHAHHAKPRQARERRYEGQSFERHAIYKNLSTTKSHSNLNDKEVVERIATNHTGFKREELSSSELITRFGMHYDFRNKRLPVWQINFDQNGVKLFVDPVSGLVVDKLVNRDRYEGYSFSLLHKWNFLTPITGRFWRDVLVVIVLTLSLIMMIFGLATSMKRIKLGSSSIKE